MPCYCDGDHCRECARERASARRRARKRIRDMGLADHVTVTHRGVLVPMDVFESLVVAADLDGEETGEALTYDT